MNKMSDRTLLWVILAFVIIGTMYSIFVTKDPTGKLTFGMPSLKKA